MAAHEVSSDPATASNISVHPSVSALKERQIMALKGERDVSFNSLFER